jgi:hypothetical protein
VQRSLAEDVVGGDQHEQRLALTSAWTAASDAPLPYAHRSAYTARTRPPKAADAGRDRPGVVADHDPFQAAGEEGPHGPLDQAQATQPEKGLGATPGDRFQPLGPARGQHPTPTRGSRDSGEVGWTTSARPGNEASRSGGSSDASATRQLPE